ncbi:MAG TPA: hypothetical protein VGE97_08205 [Nitrososphaera sp.]|jgi:hypothetical protein
MSSSSQQKEKEQEEITGKCAYSNCQHDDEEKTTVFSSLKDTDYKFHNDCYGMWAVESRNNGKFSLEDRIKVLEEQQKSKSSGSGSGTGKTGVSTTTSKETKR